MTQAIGRGYCPLVLGGDHACAIGTWKGAAKAVAKKGALGLVWLDAHLDAHTPETTPSGMLHGMPLAVLLGRGDARLLRLTGGIGIDPKHLCVVGARSFEPEEEKLLRELGVSVIDMARIQTIGLRGAIETAVQIAAGAPGGWGLSIDLDVIDPIDAPGVGSPVAAGLALESLVDSLHALAWRPGLVAVELAEYNPSRDPDQRTRLAAESIVRAIFAA
jgi:arginase family enzyme